MLVIRDEQMHVLEEANRLRFEQRMVEAMRLDFQPKFDFLGENGIRRLIRHAIAKAGTLRIHNEGAITVLIELMVQFGERFECSPDRRWAEKILAHPVLPDYIRVSAVRERMMARTAGRTLVPFGGKAAATVVEA